VREIEEFQVLPDLDGPERMQLMKFVCSFAWVDLEIHRQERIFVANMVQRLDLAHEEAVQVQRWLDVPPRADEIDPTAIPLEHRKTFVEAIVGIIESDGVIKAEERDSFALFEHLLQ